MKRLFMLMLAIACHQIAIAQTTVEEVRLNELDQYWSKLSETVEEGDFDSYAALYHPDAVLISLYGKQPGCVPISSALENWKQGFLDTKSGKNAAKVDFRFANRAGTEQTAYEAGIFNYSSTDTEGKVYSVYVHFEQVLVKKDGNWLTTVENQQKLATEDEWEALDN